MKLFAHYSSETWKALTWNMYFFKSRSHTIITQKLTIGEPFLIEETFQCFLNMSRLHLPWSPVYLLMLRFFTLRPTLSNFNNFIWTYSTNVCHFKCIFNVKMTTLVTSGHKSLYRKYWKNYDSERFRPTFARCIPE